MLKNKATYIYKITLLVVLILLVLFLSRNFLFSSFNDSVRPVANAVAVSAIEYEKRAEQSGANNSYVLQERVMELQKIITNRDTNLALPLINLFVSSANASEYGLILIKTGSLYFAV